MVIRLDGENREQIISSLTRYPGEIDFIVIYGS